MPQTLETKTHYRADIQGLRGIAVLLVVVYHTGLALPGGFVGVDIFFVISGFVITQVLIREYEETGRIKLGQFYARRARRLIPALSIVTIFTLLISLVAMSPFGEQQQIIKTAIASTFFAGNIHLFAMNSYEALKDNPLRHLWSLGVEEQFYWVYPVFFLMLLRIARKQFINVLTKVLIAFAIVSFGFGVLLTYGFEFGYTESSVLSTRFAFLGKIGFQPGGDWPAKFAFFGAPARFWEISLGAITAIIAKQKPRMTLKGGSALLVLLMLLIIFSSLAFESSSLFPGFLALVPTIGTALLILFNHQSEVVSGFLRSRFLVNLGNVSYSLYLWHWPFVVFSRAIWPDSSHASVIAATLSIFPSVISYMCIETRFQRPLADSKVKNFFGVCFLLVVPLLVSFAAYKIANTGLGLPGLGTKQNFASDNFCGDAKSPEFQIYDCVFGESNAMFSAVLFGDSTARSLSDGVFAAVSELSGDLTISVSGGCKFYASSFEKNEICIDTNLERFEYLKISKPDVVIMSNRQIFESCGLEPLRLTGLIFGEELRTEFSKNSKRYRSELRETLKIVAGLGIPVISIEEIPWCGPSEPTLLRPQVKSVEVPPKGNLAQIFLDDLRELTLSFKGNSIVQTKEVLCNKQTCDYFFEGKPLYADPTHLTAIGSMRLKPAIVVALKEVLEQP
jgi:peptidoglycan/LPS O-acetylase OafA/YrhL